MDRHEQFTRCWTQAQPLVASYLGALVPDFRDAEDLLQNVAVVCLRKFGDYDAQRPFVAWALGIARFEVLRCRRARALRDCLQRLQSRAHDLVRLRYDEELKPAAIADRLRMAVVAVRVMLSRTRASLRDCIERKLRRERLIPNSATHRAASIPIAFTDLSRPERFTGWCEWQQLPAYQCNLPQCFPFLCVESKALLRTEPFDPTRSEGRHNAAKPQPTRPAERPETT